MSYYEPDLEVTGNFITDHWSGRYSLARSYWVNGVLIAGFGGALLVAFISQSMTWDISVQFSAAISIAAFALGIAIWVWSAVGIWRSAGYHTGRGGRNVWAVFARIAVILGAITTFGQLVQSMPGLIESASLATNNDTLGEPAKILIDKDAVILAGPIALGTAENFAEVLEANPQVKLLKLSSIGGRIGEAELLADQIRDRGLDVETVGECSSACTIALLAGAKRWRKRKWIGFHQPSFPGAGPRERAQMKNALRQVYLRAGLPNSFIDKALTSSPEAMWYPTEQELYEANVLNHIPEERLIRDFQSISYYANKNGPVKVDAITVLTETKASNKTLTRFFRVSAARADFDVGKAQASIRATVAESLCSEPMVPQFMAAGATYRFVYRDRNGAEFMNFNLTKCE